MPVRICLNRHCGDQTIVLDNCNREKEAHILQVFFVAFLKRGYDYQWTILIQVYLSELTNKRKSKGCHNRIELTLHSLGKDVPRADVTKS